jgi:prolipoprotein diacylglyceryltransferase
MVNITDLIVAWYGPAIILGVIVAFIVVTWSIVTS